MSKNLTTDTILGLTPSQVASIVGELVTVAANAFAPGAQIAGMTIHQITGLAVGVANEVPAALEAVEDLKAMANSDEAPTPVFWAKINLAADQAHEAAQAAADRVIGGG